MRVHTTHSYFDFVPFFAGRLPALRAPVTAVSLGEPPTRNLTLVWADIFAWRDSPVWNTSALRVAGKRSGFKRLKRFERGFRASLAV